MGEGTQRIDEEIQEPCTPSMGEQIPHRGFGPRSRKWVSANARVEDRVGRHGIVEGAADQPRKQDAREQPARAVDRLR